MSDSDDLASGLLDVLGAPPPKRTADIFAALAHVVGCVLFATATDPNAPAVDLDTGLAKLEGHFASAVHTVVRSRRAATSTWEAGMEAVRERVVKGGKIPPTEQVLADTLYRLLDKMDAETAGLRGLSRAIHRSAVERLIDAAITEVAQDAEKGRMK
jgi:hypothetical protein